MEEPCSIVLGGSDFAIIAMGAGVGFFLLGYIASALVLASRRCNERVRGPVLLAREAPPPEV